MHKRILHIAEASGGVERYLVTLLTKMKKYDAMHILVCSITFDVKKFNGLVDDIVVVDEMHNAISLSHDSKAIFAVRKAIKKYKPDIVYCHSSKAGTIGRVADMGIKNKLIYNAHGWSFNMKGVSGKKIKFYRAVEKMLALMTDKIVCISEYEKESALKYRICNEGKLIVINNGIDFDEYRKIHVKSRSELGIPKDAFVVGTVGRLTLQKAPDLFVEAAGEVKKKVDKVFFIMVGDGSESSETKEKIKEAGLEKYFLITGWVDNPLDYMGCFDVAALFSRWEGFGLVLPEYMLMKKPIVATKTDAIPYVVGDAGILIKVDDNKSAAKAIVELYEDKEFRSQIIAKGNERVKMFDAQRMADETIALIDFLTK